MVCKVTNMPPAAGETLDRSACALASREGDDPSTATYTCAGCGTAAIGFGRWRNHMKRAKKHKDGFDLEPKHKKVVKPEREILKQTLEAPTKSTRPESWSAPLGSTPKAQAEPVHKDDPSDEDETSEEKEDDDNAQYDAEPAEQLGPAARPGKRWVGEVGKSGKRQRKFY